MRRKVEVAAVTCSVLPLLLILLRFLLIPLLLLMMRLPTVLLIILMHLLKTKTRKWQ